MAADWNIDFEEALRLHAGRQENEFVTCMRPMAEGAARFKSRIYAGTPLATQIDYDECLSVAMETLMNIARKRVSDNTTPSSFRNLCSAAIRNQLIGLEREVIGRRSKKYPQHVALANQYAAPVEGDEAGRKEVVDHLKYCVDSLCTEGPARVFRSYIDRVLHDVDDRNAMAKELGTTTGIIKTQLDVARKALRRCSEIKDMLLPSGSRSGEWER